MPIRPFAGGRRQAGVTERLPVIRVDRDVRELGRSAAGLVLDGRDDLWLVAHVHQEPTDAEDGPGQ